MKYSLLLALTAGLLAAPLHADETSGADGITVSGEALYWRPIGADIPLVDNYGGASSNLSHGFSPGYRVRLEKDGWYAAWTDLESGAHTSATCPGSNCFSLQGFGEDASSYSGNSELRLQILDVGLRSDLADSIGSKDLKVSGEFGFRYVRVYQDTNEAYVLTLPFAETEFLQTHSDTGVFGLHLGFDADAKLSSKVRLVAGAGGSLLDGQARYQYEDGGVAELATSTHVLVPEIEMSAKVVASPLRDLKLWVGWEFMSFTNMIPVMATEISSTSPSGTKSIGFTGPSAGGSWRF